ncbi:MAG TPA: hypothetical protein VGJ77_14410 [Gaiellaceae bacterium]
MTAAPTPTRRPSPRRSRVRAALLPLSGAVVVFALGIAVGEALHDNPRPGGTQTLVRTLNPLPLAPAARETVTLTTTNP